MSSANQLYLRLSLCVGLSIGLAGCGAVDGFTQTFNELTGRATNAEGPLLKAEALESPSAASYEYIVGPGDTLDIFVWRNPELSTTVSVRPDGKISVPLVEDLQASGQTATELARGIEGVLETYVKEPLVTVIVGGFAGVYSTQVRVVGEATQPRALPYSADMTALDAMIAVGGLTEFAAGNRARLVRQGPDGQVEARVRLDDLLRGGDVSANVLMAPGDVIIIPESFF